MLSAVTSILMLSAVIGNSKSTNNNNMFQTILCPSRLENAIAKKNICKFNTEKDIKKWHSKEGAKLELTKLKDFGPCAKMSVPKNAWPGIKMRSFSFKEKRWYIFQHVCIDVFNTYAENLRFSMMLYSWRGERSHLSTYISSEASTIRKELTVYSKRAPVAEIDIYQEHPIKPLTVYFKNLRLESSPMGKLCTKLNEKLVKYNHKTTLAKGAWQDKTLKRARQLINAKIRKINESFKRISVKSPDNMLYLQLCNIADIRKMLDSYNYSLLQYAAQRVVKRFNTCFGQQGWGYFTTDGMEKVYRQNYPFSGTPKGSVNIELAKNEHESAQIILRTKHELNNIKLNVSKLKNSKGHVLDSKYLKLYIVGSVKTKAGSYPETYAAWAPDPLLPVPNQFKLEPNVWQPLWLDVFAPAAQAPGTYTGKIVITASNKKALKVPIKVKIWNFQLPVTQNFATSFSLYKWVYPIVYNFDKNEWNKFLAWDKGYTDYQSIGSGQARKIYDMDRRNQDILLANRLSPGNMYRTYPPRIDEVKRWQTAGVKNFNIIYIRPFSTLGIGSTYPAKFKKKYLDTLAEYIPKLKAAGLFDMAYVYCFDEITQNAHSAAIDMLREIKKRWPKLRIMTTAYDSTFGLKSGLDKYIDIWVPGTLVYEKNIEQVEKARARGKKIWWYVANGPLPPDITWLIENSGQELRLLMGFMSFKYKTDGFLYYCLNIWHSNVTSEKTWLNYLKYMKPVSDGPLIKPDVLGFTPWANGDGQIFYPGKNSMIPTIRTKVIRDGLEDYETLLLLKKQINLVKKGKIQAPADWLTKAQKAIAVSPKIVKTLSQFTKKSKDIIEERQKIATLLEQVNANGK